MERRDFLKSTSGAALAMALDPRSTTALPHGEPASAASTRAGTVQTVLGPISPDQLGFTLPHEHLVVASAGFLQTWPELFGGRTALTTRVAERLKAAKDEGVTTIVDVTPVDVGRDVRFLQEVSRRSGMQILACTGHWLNPSLSMSARTVEELKDLFIREIEGGIDGTDIRAGVIKVATDREGVTPFLDRTLRAAARASKATGIPVTTHSVAQERIGEKQAAIFEAEGLAPSSVCIGHSDDTEDVDYLLGLARRGYTIGMDHLTWGIPQTPPAGGNAATSAKAGPISWQRRAQVVRRLVDAGVADRLFLSHDWYFDSALGPTGRMRAMEARNPDGMLFVSRKVLPYLREIGVTDDAIRTMTVSNPKRFFGRL